MLPLSRLDKIVDWIVLGLEALPDSTGTICLASLPIAMYGFLSELQYKGRNHCSWARTRYGHLFDAFASFASTEWTDEQLQTIMTAPYTPCKCNKRLAFVRELHRTISPWDPAYKPSACLNTIISFVYYFLSGACLSIPRGKLEKHSPHKWPESAASFIPHGGATFLRASMRWINATGNTSPLQALGVITRFCDSLVKAILSSQKFLELVAEKYSWFAKVLGDNRGSLITVQRNGTGKQQYPAKLDAMPLEVVQTLADFYYLFHDMSAGVAVGHDLFFHWLAPKAGSIYQSTVILIDLLPFIDVESHPDMKLANATAIFSDLGCHSYDFARLSEPLHPTLHAFKFDKPRMSTYTLSYTALRLFMGQIRIHSACCNVNCTNTCESLGRPFEFCAGCRVVRYCSHECQKAAWTNPLPYVAHKPVCKNVGKIYPFRSHGKSPDLNAEQESKLFEEKLLEIGLTVSQIGEVTNHLAELAMAFEEKKLISAW